MLICVNRIFKKCLPNRSRIWSRLNGVVYVGYLSNHIIHTDANMSEGRIGKGNHIVSEIETDWKRNPNPLIHKGNKDHRTENSYLDSGGRERRRTFRLLFRVRVRFRDWVTHSFDCSGYLKSKKTTWSKKEIWLSEE